MRMETHTSVPHTVCSFFKNIIFTNIDSIINTLNLYVGIGMTSYSDAIVSVTPFWNQNKSY